MKFKIILLFSLIFGFQSYSQNISINEIMSSNSNTISDEDGEYEDWIEIYNFGSTTVSLKGYGLSD